MPLRDFYIWTFVHDMSEVATVEFHYRVDNDGENPIHDTANEVYACDHKFVRDWVSAKMIERIFPKVHVSCLIVSNSEGSALMLVCVCVVFLIISRSSDIELILRSLLADPVPVCTHDLHAATCAYTYVISPPPPPAPQGNYYNMSIDLTCDSSGQECLPETIANEYWTKVAIRHTTCHCGWGEGGGG